MALTPVFERSVQTMRYLSALTAAYTLGYRIYDPSHSVAENPDGEQMMLRDIDIAKDFEHRWMLIAGRRGSWSPADEGDKGDEMLASILTKACSHIRGFTSARFNLARADLTGARYAAITRREVVAPFGDGKKRRWIVPVELRDMPKERFQWRPDVSAKSARSVLQYGHIARGHWTWVDVPADAPLVIHVIGDSEETLHYGRGLREALHYWWKTKTHVLQAWINGAESFGHGRLVLKLASKSSSVHTVTNAELVREAQVSLAKMRAQHTFILDKDDTLELVAPSGEAHKILTDLYSELKSSISQLVLHAVLPTGGGSETGSYARAGIENDSTDSVIDLRSENLSETITDYLGAPFCRWNYANLREMGLADADHPHYILSRARPQDPKMVADRIEVLSRAKIPLKKSEVYDGVGFTKPGDEDEVFDWQDLASPGDFGAGFEGGAPGGGGEEEDTKDERNQR